MKGTPEVLGCLPGTNRVATNILASVETIMKRRTFLILGANLAAVAGLSVPGLAEEVGTTGSRLTSAEAKAATLLHNKARAEVGVRPLVWSNKLARFAQNWADHLASSGEFQHSNGPYGENLAGGSTLEKALGSWLSEKQDYRPGDKGERWSKTGHYTQIVWGDTREFGCGKAQGTDYVIWVCEYDPPGNMAGEDPY